VIDEPELFEGRSRLDMTSRDPYSPTTGNLAISEVRIAGVR
jgi:hypothetical protein